ncbi:MAG: hypothetical protein M0Q92_14595 [Methanoregula sp.]|jgi:hypothetical protein|nr:hypothetical protein [Methanoregula sp.]
MAGLRDDAQWIVLMGFIVSFSLFFVAIVINQSTVVGQTTAEAVIEFPKNDIRGMRDMIIQSEFLTDEGVFNNKTNVQNDIKTLSLHRQNSVVSFSSRNPTGSDPHTYIEIHYYNGVTAYNETWRSN